MLHSLNENDGKTIVVVTHDTEVAEAMKRIIAFRDGRIVEDRSVVPKRINAQSPDRDNQ